MMTREEFQEKFMEIYNKAKFTDRGNKKWTAMMLPEHIKELRQDEENYNKVSRPQLDEFDLQTMQEEVERALTSKHETRITSWCDGILHYHRGVIQGVSTQYVSYEDPFGKHRIPIHEMVAVMIME